MGISRRIDGNLIKDLPSFRKINPFVMRGRNESVIYFSQTVDITETRRYLREANKSRIAAQRLGLFHVILAAAVRTVALRPQLNRFVSGQLIYQRNRLQISFMVKKEMTDEGQETNAKITFSPLDTLDDVQKRTSHAIDGSRNIEGNVSDHEVDFFGRLPRFMINMVVKAFRFLDYFGLAPNKMVEIDPLFTSIYAAHLGSLGLDAAFHHLYEWGNASLFMVIGKVYRGIFTDKNGSIRTSPAVDINFTLDDRISEGIYTGKALSLFQEFLQNPVLLQEPPDLSSELIEELNLLPVEPPPEPR